MPIINTERRNTKLLSIVPASVVKLEPGTLDIKSGVAACATRPVGDLNCGWRPAPTRSPRVPYPPMQAFAIQGKKIAHRFLWPVSFSRIPLLILSRSRI